MRKWYKYIVNYENNLRSLPKDKTFCEHKEWMGHDSGRGYNSKEEFFRTHFYNGRPQVRHYHDYLRQYLKKEEEVLSVGSGRCINELLLIEQGFNIVCSDLDQPHREETLRLFSNLRFINYDITSSPFSYKFDSIICLSIFYLFDRDQLFMAFKNINGSLRPGGKFILDPGGATDNLITYINDEIICKYEAYLLHMIQKLRKRRCVVSKKHQGYRTTNKEMILIAKKAGFTLSNLESGDYLTEIGKRSMLLQRFPERIINAIGRFSPYVRMFTFIKDI